MKPLRIAATIALLAWPVCAHAQMPKMNMLPDEQSKTPEQIEQEQQRDKAYKESLKKIPDAKTNADPWGGVRNSDTPKSTMSSKTPAPTKQKTKTGSNAN
jgi:hypothetical protein